MKTHYIYYIFMDFGVEYWLFKIYFLNHLFFNRQLSPEDLAQVPANSTSNILNRLMVSYDPRIRPNFQGNAVVWLSTGLFAVVVAETETQLFVWVLTDLH